MTLGAFKTNKSPSAKPKRKYVRKAKVVPPPPVDVSPKAIKIAKDLNLNWPNNEAKDLERFIQLNLNYYTSFSKRLGKLYKEAPSLLKTNSLGRTIQIYNRIKYIYFCHPAPVEFINWWVLEINSIDCSWPAWNGNIMEWVMHDDHQRLDKYMARIMADHFGDGSFWYDVKQFLRGVKE
jgi:hypothetical protein